MAINTFRHLTWSQVSLGITGAVLGAYVGANIGTYFSFAPCMTQLENIEEIKQKSLQSVVGIAARDVAICAFATTLPSAALGALGGVFIVNQLAKSTLYRS